MLGCQDFCGYYEWTFHYLRRRFGKQALEKYWAQAIAADSQRHYIQSAQQQGLRGLYESWLKTGDDEQCDWSVCLDEEKNLLRLDMRQCPSKGFLLERGLNADEDYCDHCMGWISPALHQIGAEVAAHEHNHCGQCWWEIRVPDVEQPLVQLADDIRRDSRWGQGYLHRYEHHQKLPVDDKANADSCDVLAEWFRDTDTVLVLGPMVKPFGGGRSRDFRMPTVVSGRRYADGNCPLDQLRGVILEHDPLLLPAIAERFNSSRSRPLLIHCYLPGQPMLNFAEHGLPRATPILPLLIRSGIYTHQTREPYPDVSIYAVLLAAALGKRIVIRDFEADGSSPNPAFRATGERSDSLTQSELDHIRNAWRHVDRNVDMPPNLRRLMGNAPR